MFDHQLFPNRTAYKWALWWINFSRITQQSSGRGFGIFGSLVSLGMTGLLGCCFSGVSVPNAAWRECEVRRKQREMMFLYTTLNSKMTIWAKNGPGLLLCISKTDIKNILKNENEKFFHNFSFFLFIKKYNRIHNDSAALTSFIWLAGALWKHALINSSSTQRELYIWRKLHYAICVWCASERPEAAEERVSRSLRKHLPSNRRHDEESRSPGGLRPALKALAGSFSEQLHQIQTPITDSLIWLRLVQLEVIRLSARIRLNTLHVMPWIHK